MKYATNHPTEFYLPMIAWSIGFMQGIGGILCEIACVLFLSTIEDVLMIIIKFIALGSIAKIDDFYAAALPDENKVKKNRARANLEIKNHRRLYRAQDDRACGVKALGVVTKIIRIIYCSLIFYFIPFIVLFIPYMAAQDNELVTTGEEVH